MSTATQKAAIRAALGKGDRLTWRDAYIRWGCSRLGARIWDLKRDGLAIAREMVKRGDAYVAEYWLERT